MSADKSAKWLQKAIDRGIAEWIHERASNQVPAPDAHELSIYRLAFSAGACATIEHMANVLSSDEQ